jgi:Zn-dependent protease
LKSIWSFDVGTVGKTVVRVHLSLALLLLWLYLGDDNPGPTSTSGGQPAAVTYEWLIVAIIAALAVHEVGHLLAARFFSLRQLSLTLYPFGGVASLEKTPSTGASLAYTVAGPVANLVTAGALWAFHDPVSSTLAVLSGTLSEATPLQQFLGAQILVGLVNSIPAVPLDGGKALRAVLISLGAKNASVVVARSTQVCCVLTAVVAASYSQPTLFLLAFLMFLGAFQEHVRSEGRAVSAAYTVGDAMIPKSRLESFTHGTTVSSALKAALTSLQPLYPVLTGDTLVGIVPRELLLQHAALEPDEYLSALVIREVGRIDSSAPLTDALSAFEDSGAPMLVVTVNGVFSGVLVADRVSEFLLMKSLPEKSSSGDDVPWSIQP